MDKGMGRVTADARVARAPSPAQPATTTHVAADAFVRGPSVPMQSRQEFEGIVRNGVVELNGKLPEGTRVQVRVKT